MKKSISLISLLAALLFLVGCSATDTPSTDTGKQSKPTISSITAGDNPIYTFKYDALGRLTEYKDLLFNGTFEVSYNPISITLTYYSPADDGTAESATKLYDVELNDLGFISACKSRTVMGSWDETATPVNETNYVLSYDHNGRMTELSRNDGYYIRLEWDEEGRLLKSSSPEYENTYLSTTTPNTHRQWIPLWYACGGLEVTGLFGNPPSALIASGVQTFTDGSTSTAEFAYTLTTDNRIKALGFTEDDNAEVHLVFNYAE